MKKKMLLMVFLCVCFLTCGLQAQINVSELLVENMSNPDGIAVKQPHFSWRITSQKQALVQTSYRIQVSASPEKFSDSSNLLWDSGDVQSDQSLLIPYYGKALKSCSSYYWRVKISTNHGKSAWSKPAYWSMAFLDSSEWKAMWIGRDSLTNPRETMVKRPRLSARYLRKEFEVHQPVRRAMLYICGLGSSKTFINGKVVSNEIFETMVSWFKTRVYYNTYDVTKLIGNETNTFAVILGNGRYFNTRAGKTTDIYGFPKLIAQLDIEYADGSHQLVLTDKTWKVTSQGPITANNELDGEEYDTHFEMAGWNVNGFNDAAWEFAQAVPAPCDKICARTNPGIEVQDEVKPISIKDCGDGRYIIDMGQNMVGWVTFKQLLGKKNQPVSFRYSEILTPRGDSLYVANLRSSIVKDIYMPSSDGVFSWEPTFVYHGFRFVEISGLESKPELSSFIGKVFYDKMETTGSFTTSNALVNQIYKNAYWGIRGNYRGMPTDCPQRDERQGWLGDRSTGCFGESFLFSNSLLYSKWMQDIEDCQREDGAISDVSPRFYTIYSDNITWPSTFFYGSEMIYEHFGDVRPIINHYAAMKKFIEHNVAVRMKDYIMTKDSYGDWCMPPESQELIHSKDPARVTAGPVLSTTVFYDLLNKMVQFAQLSGHESDIPYYQNLAAKIKESYNTKYFHADSSYYSNNTATANLLSLRLGLVPKGSETKVFENIVNKTEKDFGSHVSCGVLGIQHLMRGLTEYGRCDLAYKILTNDTYPSWGYMVKKGATTIWELWNGDTADPAMNSGNHVMLLGDLLIWYYEDLAGIKCAPDALAFKKLLMQPVFPDGLDEVSATFDSVYGTVGSSWSTKGGKFCWDITLPPNTSAVVRIPTKFKVSNVMQKGVSKISNGSDYTECVIGSGCYHFSD